ncbi:uncharacterized protein [Littorina saxatilis]|uniref:uncharacterized protein n=1 Tax=Littorina saxatilis TaxID=31220 RepID=UPI0038B4C1F7
MAGVLLLSCFLLAVAGMISVQSPTHLVRKDAQQLTEEPLREKRTAPSQTGKSDDGLGAVVAQLVSELSSLKDKQHALEISQLTAKSELQSTKSELQSTKSELQSTMGELQNSQSKIETKVKNFSLSASTFKKEPG